MLRDKETTTLREEIAEQQYYFAHPARQKKRAWDTLTLTQQDYFLKEADQILAAFKERVEAIPVIIPEIDTISGTNVPESLRTAMVSFAHKVQEDFRHAILKSLEE